jgi:hypothetical protein
MTLRYKLKNAAWGVAAVGAFLTVGAALQVGLFVFDYYRRKNRGR